MGENNSFLSGLGSIGLGAASNIAMEGIDQIFGITKKREQRQLEQQKQLNEQQIQGAIRLGTVNKENSMDIWNRTAAPAQMAKLKEAGLNPALMYGSGGGGGGQMSGSTTQLPTGGVADGAAATGNNQIGMALMGAQLKLLNAQTEKVTAEANKTKGVDTTATTQQTSESQSRQKNIDFQNAVNEAVGNISDAEARRAENSLKGMNMERENLMWETFKKEGWKSGSTEDGNNMVNKAMKAGWEKVITDLQNARKDGEIKNAQIAIEGFKAGLAREGISPDSPWYIKIVGDLLEKVGLSPIRAVKDTIK